MLVSLLPAEELDRLLRAVHALLPPVVDGTIALLRPPEPHLGDAALGLAGAEILIIRKADHEGSAASDAADERHLVWCRDDIEAAGIPAGMGTAVVAESLEALAWELVRRLSGDLSPGGHAQPVATVAHVRRFRRHRSKPRIWRGIVHRSHATAAAQREGSGAAGVGARRASRQRSHRRCGCADES